MIMSMQIAHVGAKGPLMLRRSPKPDKVPGLRYAELTTCAPLGGGLLPKPSFGRIGLFAAWEDDESFERFVAEDELGRKMAEGWQVRLEPLRASGEWHELEGVMPTPPRRVRDDEPVAVLTLGRLKLRQAGRFLRANAPAADLAVAHPAMLASTGLARPPHLVATFSLWRTAGEMRDYAYSEAAPAHANVIRAHREKPFHHESLFARFRPYAPSGEWNGGDPLADVTLASSSSPEEPAAVSSGSGAGGGGTRS
jgi:hypothetical protein